MEASTKALIKAAGEKDMKENQKESKTFLREYLQELRRIKADVKDWNKFIQAWSTKGNYEPATELYAEINKQITFLENLLGDGDE